MVRVLYDSLLGWSKALRPQRIFCPEKGLLAIDLPPAEQPARPTTVIVFDDDYEIILAYIKHFGQDFWSLRPHQVFATNLSIHPRGYPAALAALVNFLSASDCVGRIIFSDLPHADVTWEVLYQACSQWVLTVGEVYVLVDCTDETGRRGSGMNILTMPQGGYFAIEAIRLLRRKRVPPFRCALFTAGVNFSLIPGHEELSGIQIVSKSPDAFEDQVVKWWTFARQRIDSSYFQRYTAERMVLHNPTAAYGQLKSAGALAFLKALARSDFYGVWDWVISVVQRYDSWSRAYVCYVYLCAKSFLYNGDEAGPGGFGANTFDYVALRALAQGLPFALGREQGLGGPLPCEWDVSEVPGEAIDPPENKPDRWGTFAFAAGVQFGHFASALFRFLRASNQPEEGNSRLKSLELTGWRQNAATLLVEFEPALPTSIFDIRAARGNVTMAWQRLAMCCEAAAVQHDDEARTQIRLDFTRFSP
jgi:hypothetical protein